jgi:hypothetical protein
MADNITGYMGQPIGNTYGVTIGGVSTEVSFTYNPYTMTTKHNWDYGVSPLN